VCRPSSPASCSASRDNSVSPIASGTQSLLCAVGAAVIGGASLLGGRGRVYDGR
jgi:D-xylose transport system permease protein